MIDEQSERPLVVAGAAPPSVLVVGDGPTGLLVARELVDFGIGVSVMKSGPYSGSPWCGAPGIDFPEWNRGLSEVLKRVERLEWSERLQVVRKGNGFLVTSGEEPARYFACIVLAFGLPKRHLPVDLPEGVEILRPERVPSEPQSMGFLLDYESISDPAEGMTAIAQALANSTEGGESAVFMRHVPVRHLFGESLYESAKAAGVRFFRFGDRLPEVRPLPDSGGSRFLVVVNDIVEGGNPIEIQCDRVVTAVAPDPSHLPSWAVDAIDNDTDRSGYLLSSSVHCHPAKSFRCGIFAVGEATGALDFLDVSAQAASVAAEARAWIQNASASAGNNQKVSVSDECCRCLTCVRICPHTAIFYRGEAARSRIDTSAAACQECGVCVSECPRQAIDLVTHPEAPVSSFLAEVERMSGSHPLVVYGCRRSAARAIAQTQLPQGVLFCSVPCAGWVSESLLLNTAAAGATGVLVVGCHHGNCASRDGTDWAEARVKNALAVMHGSWLKDWPMRYATAAANEDARLVRVIAEFCNSIRT